MMSHLVSPAQGASLCCGDLLYSPAERKSLHWTHKQGVVRPIWLQKKWQSMCMKVIDNEDMTMED